MFLIEVTQRMSRMEYKCGGMDVCVRGVLDIAQATIKVMDAGRIGHDTYNNLFIIALLFLILFINDVAATI
jgi:hypothetical protein